MLKAELVLNGQWSIQFQRLKKNGKIACCETANVLLLLLFLDPGTSFPRCETLSKVCELSGWPLWGLGNECVGQTDRVKTLDCCWDALIQESRFTRIGCTQWCSPADLPDEFVGLVRQGAECLNGHGVEHVTGQKIAVLGRLSLRGCCCCTTGFHCAPLEIWCRQCMCNCHIPCGATTRLPWDQSQPVRPLTICSAQALGFLDCWCIGSGQCTVDEVVKPGMALDSACGFLASWMNVTFAMLKNSPNDLQNVASSSVSTNISTVKYSRRFD